MRSQVLQGSELDEPLLSQDPSLEGSLSRQHSGRPSIKALFRGRDDVGADRGTGLYQKEREMLGLPSLVQGGRHAGRSRVVYRGSHLRWTLLYRDFFITMIQQRVWRLTLMAAAAYMLSFWAFGLLYYLIVRYRPGCLYGATSLVEAWIFSVITQTTIGYGNTGPQQCWLASWLISIHIIYGCLLDAVIVGVVFARISHPKQRGRSIYISEVGVVARRDGILKFMFRIADVRRTQVVQPSVKAFLYTWGEGRVTAEGEHIPVRCEALDIGYIDGMLLLPLTIEHTIDESSPLCGHTHDSLMALNAEIVVTFEGTTEFGNPFMARRSYMPTEIVWGHNFKQVIQRPFGGDTRFSIDLNNFHEVERQVELPPLPPSELSKLVVNRAKRTVPYPLLGENTLVLSDVLCLAHNREGQLCLTCRVADTYPNQMIELTLRMFLYRWTHLDTLAEEPGAPVFVQHPLECGFKSGADRLYLRLPVEVTHVIDDNSPLRGWQEPGGIQADTHSEIVVVVSGYILALSQNRVRQRTYVVGSHVRPGYRFVPIVKHPGTTRDRKPRVRWGMFHDITPVVEGAPGGPAPALRLGAHPEARAEAFLQTRGLSQAPESHAGARSLEDRGLLRPRSINLPSIPEASGQVDVGVPAPSAAVPAGMGLQQVTWQRLGGLARTGAQCGPLDQPSDFTVSSTDLQRYAATMGPGGDTTLMAGALAGARRARLPDASFFVPPSPRRAPPPSQQQQQQQQGVDGEETIWQEGSRGWALPLRLPQGAAHGREAVGSPFRVAALSEAAGYSAAQEDDGLGGTVNGGSLVGPWLSNLPSQLSNLPDDGGLDRHGSSPPAPHPEAGQAQGEEAHGAEGQQQGPSLRHMHISMREPSLMYRYRPSVGRESPEAVPAPPSAPLLSPAALAGPSPFEQSPSSFDGHQSSVEEEEQQQQVLEQEEEEEAVPVSAPRNDSGGERRGVTFFKEEGQRAGQEIASEPSSIGAASTDTGPGSAGHSQPIAFTGRQSQGWQRGRSLANLFRVGSSRDDLELRESVKEGAGLLGGDSGEGSTPREYGASASL